ncbi:hypothetical protein TUMEXPCC7403_20835 [Tumidithrix helvetica PCC 7403]|uniref:type IV pilin-like G/H family protein n=1 Tax=Tumidithrix helvetica TaxID=3457545 RepID=UPI003CBE079C
MKSDIKSDRKETKDLDRSPLPKKNGWSLWIKLVFFTSLTGILAAIILPSFRCQAVKSKQSEARTYVGSLNRGQQAYFTENSKYGSSIDVLGVGIKTDTENFIYTTRVTTGKSFKEQSVFNYGISKSAERRSYVGGIFLSEVAASSDVTSLAILCEANAPGDTKPPDPIVKNGIPTCGANTQPVGQ